MFDRNKNAYKRGLNTALNVVKLLVAVLLIDNIIINREYYYESLRILTVTFCLNLFAIYSVN